MRSDLLFFLMIAVLVGVTGGLCYMWRNDRVDEVFFAFRPETAALTTHNTVKTGIEPTTRVAAESSAGASLGEQATLRDPFQVDGKTLARSNGESQSEQQLYATLARQSSKALPMTREQVLSKYGQPIAISQDRNRWMYEDRVVTFDGNAVESTVILGDDDMDASVVFADERPVRSPMADHRPARPSQSSISTSNRARVIKGTRNGNGPRVVTGPRRGGYGSGRSGGGRGPVRVSHFNYEATVKSGL